MFVFLLLVSQGLADNTVVAKVNKVVWDLDRPLEEDCTLELLKFEDEEAQAVSSYSVRVEFQGDHSSSHSLHGSSPLPAGDPSLSVSRCHS